MRFTSPATSIVGHLIWGDDAAVWACYEVAGSSYRYTSQRDKVKLHSRVNAFLKAVDTEALLMGLSVPVQIGQLKTAVGADVDGAAGELARHQIDTVADFELARRRFFVAVRLEEPTGRNTGWWRSLLSAGGGAFGVPPAAPSTAEVQARMRQVDELEARLDRNVEIDRVTPGVLRWMYGRIPRRGLSSEPALDEATWEPTSRTSRRGAPVTVSMAPLWDFSIAEGGLSSDPDRPKHRRYVRVHNDDEPSFQSFAYVSDMPQEWLFPGGLGEWLFRLDDFEFSVDWAQRIRVVDNPDAQRAFTKQMRELEGQVDQFAGDPAGPPPGLDAAMQASSEALATLSADGSEREVWVSTVVSCASSSLRLLESEMSRLEQDFAANQYGLHRPSGNQMASLRAMLPGSAAPRVVDDYRQYMLSRDAASAAPFVADGVGNDEGMLLGLTASGGVPSPVLLDPAAGPARNRSGSMALVGHLGSGKSWTLKRVMASAAARGSQLVVLDRTSAGEYVRFARYLEADQGARCQVVSTRPGESPVQLDPLQVFSNQRSERIAIGLLGVLTGFEPMSAEGSAIDDAVRNVARRDGAALVDVIAELEQHDDAGDVARRIRQNARGVLGELAFGNSGSQLDLNADVVVFWCPSLALPERTVQTNAHLASQMTAEQYEAMGLLFLIAGVAQEMCFRDTSRFSAFVADEVWALRANLHGAELLKSMIRDGRKHNAAVWVGTQTPAELFEDGLADLMPLRLVFRQAPEQARAALEFLGGSTSEEVIELLGADNHSEGLAPGECLMRDLDGRIARVQCLPGETPRFNAAAETNPQRLKDLAGDATLADLLDPRHITIDDNDSSSSDVDVDVADVVHLGRSGPAAADIPRRERPPVRLLPRSADIEVPS